MTRRRRLFEKKGPCWDGYERVPGTEEYEKGSCRKKGSKKNESDEVEEMEELQEAILGEEKKKGLWYYVNKRKKEGKPPK